MHCTFSGPLEINANLRLSRFELSRAQATCTTLGFPPVVTPAHATLLRHPLLRPLVIQRPPPLTLRGALLLREQLFRATDVAAKAVAGRRRTEQRPDVAHALAAAQEPACVGVWVAEGALGASCRYAIRALGGLAASEKAEHPAISKAQTAMQALRGMHAQPGLQQDCVCDRRRRCGGCGGVPCRMRRSAAPHDGVADLEIAHTTTSCLAWPGCRASAGLPSYPARSNARWSCSKPSSVARCISTAMRVDQGLLRYVTVHVIHELY